MLKISNIPIPPDVQFDVTYSFSVCLNVTLQYLYKTSCKPPEAVKILTFLAGPAHFAAHFRIVGITILLLQARDARNLTGVL